MDTPAAKQTTGWRARWERFKPYAPFAAFVFGFGFDSFTLGRSVDPIDLYLVSFYAIGALLGLIARELDLEPRPRRVAALLLQFALGGSLSALVVLYFKSTGQPFALLFVLGIFAAAVVNEVMHIDEPPQREWVVTIWAVAATMLGTFVIPHVVGSVSAIWFYACAATVGATLAALKRFVGFEWRSLRYAVAALAALVVLWVAGFVPPVPLVLKSSLVCTDFEKGGGDYSCQIDEPGLLQQLGIVSPRVTSNGDAVYCLTAVFAPDAIGVVVEHRWHRLTEDDGWKQTDTMEFEMTGGRDDGWRFWSRKRRISPGWWKVETAMKGGGVLGYEKFEVFEGEAKKVPASL